MGLESELSSSVTVRQYLELERDKKKEAITAFLKERLLERYVLPFKGNPRKNGFSMMAVSCLLIEAMESFFRGWPKSPNSELAFCGFFDRNPEFAILAGLHREFYRDVRCAILHQGETAGGWHVRRDVSALFDKTTRTVDATRFQGALEMALDNYCDVLREANWGDEVWKNFRRKMRSVCENVGTNS